MTKDSSIACDRAMSKPSKLSGQRPPPMAQSVSIHELLLFHEHADSNADTPLMLTDQQGTSHRSCVTPEPDSGRRQGSTKSRRSSLTLELDSGGQGTAKSRQGSLLSSPAAHESSIISEPNSNGCGTTKSRRSSLLGSHAIHETSITLGPGSSGSGTNKSRSSSLLSAPINESSFPSVPDRGGKGTTKTRRSSLLGPPSISHTLSPSSLQPRAVVPSEASLLSATIASALATPCPPSAPNRPPFSRSKSCSSHEAATMQAGEGKQPESQQPLQRAKTLLQPLGRAASQSPVPWQAENKLPSSVRPLPSLQSTPRARKTSFEERPSSKSDSGTRSNCFLPREVIRTSVGNGLFASELPQVSRKSAPEQRTLAAALPSTHSGSCSLISDDGPLHPAPPKEEPYAFRRKTILEPIHHIRQPLQKGLNPSRGRFSDSGTEDAEVRHHLQQQHQQQEQHLQGPRHEHMSAAASLSGAPGPQTSSIFLGEGASKRRSSGVQKQVKIALDQDLDDLDAGTALRESTRRRSTGEELIRPGSSLAGVERPAEGIDSGLMGRRARWSWVGTEDSPLSRELSACETERRLRLNASKSCEQRARANARANPSAFCAEAVEEEEAKRKLAAEAAYQSLRNLGLRSSNDAQAVDQFHIKVRLLSASRSFYHAPEAEKQQVTRATLTWQGRWTPEHSLFQQRALENDAQCVFDTPEVLDAQFERDWQRICQRGGLAQAIAAATVGRDAQHEKTINRHSEVVLQLEEVRRELRSHIHLIHSCFIFFAALAPTQRPHELMFVRMQDFCEFTRSCNLSDPRLPSCKPADTEAIFKACKGFGAPSGVQQGTLQEGQATHPHLLNRSEFLECIVRLAIAKHVGASHDVEGQPNVADAVDQLLEEDIEPNLSPSAKVDANSFRKDRLYSEDIEGCIRIYWDLLKVAFKVYSGGGKTLGIEGWLSILAAGALLGRANHTGIDKHAAKAMFMLSQATVVDELCSPQSRAEGLTFFDFVEALARLSEVLCAPTPNELASLFQSHPPLSRPISAKTSGHPWTALMDEPSSESHELGGPASTPSISHTEASTIPPLLSKLSDPYAAGIGSSVIKTSENGFTDNNNNSSQALSHVHRFFKDMLQWPQLCKYRMQEAGLDKALHMTACHRPLLDSFAPMMELFESGMRRTWGGQSQADTVAKMEASLGLKG